MESFWDSFVLKAPTSDQSGNSLKWLQLELVQFMRGTFEGERSEKNKLSQKEIVLSQS